MMIDCIFCKIINKEIPADIVYEDDEVLGFKSIESETPVHLLFIPKKHLEWKDDFTEQELALLSRIVSIAKKTAQEKDIFDACKLIFNVGKAGHVSHIHLHLLGGWDKDNVPMENV